MNNSLQYPLQNDAFAKFTAFTSKNTLVAICVSILSLHQITVILHAFVVLNELFPGHVSLPN